MATQFRNPPLPPDGKKPWPTMYDLPSEEIGEEAVPDEFHIWQGVVLSLTFQPPGYSPDRCFSAVDMYLYFDPDQKAKRPDWFGVLDVPRQYKGRDLRDSYAPWDEGQVPLVVVELLSRSTAKNDLGETVRDTEGPHTKWEVYEEVLRIPYYVIFSKRMNQMRVFRHDGKKLVEEQVSQGRYWIPEANLGLGLWLGRYEGLHRLWMRWFDAAGNWIPLPQETLQQVQQDVEIERHEKEVALEEVKTERLEKEAALLKAETERLKAEKLAAKLKELGIDSDLL